jgi:GT2 family glycosyltransferase
MTPPRFSIVITSCNQHGFIGEAVESALALRHASYEIIVVDDASTDGSGEFLQSYGATIQVVALPTNHGRGGARNRGAAVATGDYLVFLDGDDVLLPWALDVYDAIACTSAPQLLCATMRWFPGSTTGLDTSVVSESVTFVKYEDYLHKDRPFGVSASAIVVGRAAFTNIGGWSTLPVLEDQELLLRLCTVGPTVQILSPATVGHRQHAAQAVSEVPPFLPALRELIWWEKDGRFPGGTSRRGERLAMLGGLAYFWCKRAYRARAYRAALALFADTWLLQVRAAARRLKARMAGRRPDESIAFQANRKI